MYFHAAVLVAVDFLAGRAGDDGGLAAEDFGFGVFELGAIEDVPGRGGEAVAVALGEVVIPLSPTLSRQGRGSLIVHSRGIGDGLLQHLWLFALVVDFGEQPKVVPLLARVVGEGEEVATRQVGVADPLGQFVISAQALQAAFGQVLASDALGEAAGIVVGLQRRREFAAVARFHL